MKRATLIGTKVASCFIVLLLFISWTLPVVAQEQAPADKRLADTLRQYVEELKDEPDAAGMVVGYEVYSLDRQQTLAAMYEKKTFVPASTMKTLVTATALDRWPSDQRFPTKLYIDGQVTKGGVLRGDIVLKGYGDPVLTPEQLRKLARSLAERGVRRINGNIVVDDRYFDAQRLGPRWMWDDEPYAYSAQISALTVNKNTVDVLVEPTKPGKKPKVSITPAPDYVKVINRATTVEGSEDDLTVERPRLKNEIVVSGTIGVQYDGRLTKAHGSGMENTDQITEYRSSRKAHQGVQVTRTVENPALFAGHVLRENLKEVGIALHPRSKVAVGKVNGSQKLVAETASPTLDAILRELMKDSDNLIAETLVKQLGAREQEEGSTEAGLAEIAAFAKDVAGLDSGYVQKDGSGLSRLNVISPHHLVQLLVSMDAHPAGERFRSFLPVAGVDGTLQNRMVGTAAEGNVQAKTGSMSGVNALAGYVKTGDGERLAFSIMMNGVYKSEHALDMQDRIAVALASYPDLPEPDLPSEEPTTYPLSAVFDPILDDERYAGVIQGVAVRSLESGKTLYERNAHTLMTPASNTQLFTSATALAQLGPDYRFRTEVYRTGRMRGHVLHGDLIIKGYGDPTLTTEGMSRGLDGPTVEEMVEEIRDLGIRQIKGDIVVDESAFADHVYGPGWVWDKESDDDQPQITALSANQGTVRLEYEPGDKPGDGIDLKLTPDTTYVQVIDEAVTGVASSKPTLQVKRERGFNVIRLTGSLPCDFDGASLQIPVENPALYTGQILRERLQERGVRFHPNSEVRAGELPDGAELVQTYWSPPLSEIVRFLNHYNDNYVAEMILKTIGFETGGEGTFAGGVKAVDAYRETLGIASRWDMLDGSGLTRYNLFSADQIVSLLQAVREEPSFRHFFDSLPVAGEEGALRRRMQGTEAEHNVKGKVGAFTHVRALSGYVKTRDGEWLAYAILTNGFTEASLIEMEDRLAVAMAEFTTNKLR